MGVGVRVSGGLISSSSHSSGPPSSMWGPSRLGYIDGLRACAAILVLMRHYYMGTYTPDYPRWADALGLGYIGVHLFLLLSDFASPGRMLASGSSGSPPPSTSDGGRRAYAGLLRGARHQPAPCTRSRRLVVHASAARSRRDAAQPVYGHLYLLHGFVLHWLCRRRADEAQLRAEAAGRKLAALKSRREG
jgi:hypothetical protein